MSTDKDKQAALKAKLLAKKAERELNGGKPVHKVEPGRTSQKVPIVGKKHKHKHKHKHRPQPEKAAPPTVTDALKAKLDIARSWLEARPPEFVHNMRLVGRELLLQQLRDNEAKLSYAKERVTRVLLTSKSRERLRRDIEECEKKSLEYRLRLLDRTT